MTLMERLEARETVVHDADEYRETVEPINPDGPEAAALIRELVEVLEKIAAGNFNCSPHQHGMAMQAVAEIALAKAKASSPTKQTQETEDVVERLRNASRLAQKKYVANSSELFDLAADRLEDLSDRIDVLEGAGNRLAEMVKLIKHVLVAILTKRELEIVMADLHAWNVASLRTTHREVNDAK